MTNQNAISMYGDRDQLREMADRIKRMLPGGAKMSDGDALGLAQIGLAHDLDPFAKEVWLIFNEETGKSYGIMVGIQGWRKHARKQSEYWGVGGTNGFTRVTDPSIYGAGPNDIVYEYRIADTVSIEAWSASVKRLREATGLPFEQVQSMVGPMPVSVGVGIFAHGDRSKMKPYQAAQYRAERDCLRRRFQINFGIAGLMEIDAGPDDEQEVVDAEVEYCAEESQEQVESTIAAPSEPLAHLMGIVTGGGTPYPHLSNDDLSGHSIGLVRALKENHLTAEKKAEYERKLAAIKEILTWRAANP